MASCGWAAAASTSSRAWSARPCRWMPNGSAALHGVRAARRRGHVCRARAAHSRARDADRMVAAGVEQTPVADRDALRRRLTATVAQGGEGLVLHLASAAYRPGRSDVTMKLKPELDAEAVVVAHHPGQGRNAGELGALEVRAPDGRQFLTAAASAMRSAVIRPPLAVVVTIAYTATPTLVRTAALRELSARALTRCDGPHGTRSGPSQSHEMLRARRATSPAG